MGRKVLISFIGTGPVDNKNNSGKRVYKTARYRFEEKEIETFFRFHCTWGVFKYRYILFIWYYEVHVGRSLFKICDPK